jgi:hypothetical protein
LSEKSPERAVTRSSGFLSYAHSFRGIAILMIVGGHAIWVFDWPEDSLVRNGLADLLENGTVLFVFVAGFFFHYLSARFEYWDYLGKKLKNVILPYCLMAAPSVLISSLVPSFYHEYPALEGRGFVFRAGWFLINAGAGLNRALWFIPMITLFYLAAPLLMFFVRYPRLFLLVPPLVIVSAFAHRDAYPNLDILGLAFYYLSAYLAGMWASHQRARLEKLLPRIWPWLAAAVAVATILMVTLADHHGNYEGARLFSQEHGVIDWVFLQKMLVCLTLLGVTMQFQRQIAGPLKFFGDTSFAIFFIHYYFIVIVAHIITAVSASTGLPLTQGGFLPWMIAFTVVVAASVGCIAAARKLLGRRSRMIIGS